MTAAPTGTVAPSRDETIRRETAAAVRSIRDVERACPGLTRGQPPLFNRY